MNITLNLATRPYIELRTVYARLRILAVALAILGLPMLLVLHVEETKAANAQARVAQLHSNTDQLRQQQARARALVLEGPNAAVIRKIDYLNGLFRHKAFSWTATVVDLENVLPYGVEVRGIEPVIAPDGRVAIRLRVDGPRERAVEVVRNLEHSRHFIAPHLVQETAASQENGGQHGRMQPINTASATANEVQFDILADYRPLPNSHDTAGLREAKAEHTAGRAEVTNPDAAHRTGSRAGRRTRHRNGHRTAKPAPGAAATGGTR